MSATIDRISDTPRKLLMVVSNPAVSTTLGGPVGFWASELIHAWSAFTEEGYDVTIASPDGGEVQVDAYSDPRDASRYSAEDLLSLGFLNSPEHVALLESTKPLKDCHVEDFEAIVVVGGQGPMFTFPTATVLHDRLREFYEAQKVTAALCHGTCALLYVRLSDGTPLVRGKTMTGFANSEEDFADGFVGRKVMPFRIEDEARKLGANFITGGRFKRFATRDGRLITGQQQYSGRATAELVIRALGI
jgi:putative intracellular protease/amidase